MIILDNYYENRDDALALIKNSEDTFDRHIKEIADDICGAQNLRYLTLSGPSCSGKTTTASKLTAAIEKHGRRARVISIDDFYYEKQEMDDRSITDLEGAAAVNIPLFRKTVYEIARGKSTLMPTFDFARRERSVFTEYVPHEEDVYIFEGIQALYPEISAVLSPLGYKSIFINVAVGIDICGTVFERSDIRFIRRVIRDAATRGTPPEKTVQLWAGVRKNEELNIYPNMGHGDYIINSALPYEIFVTGKKFLEKTEDYSEDKPFSMTVYNLRKRITELSSSALSPDMIPVSSVLREFVD